VGQGHQKQVAETVAAQTVSRGKAVVEEFREELFVFRQCYHAIADVARGENAHRAAQTPGASSLVSNRNDRSQSEYLRLPADWVHDSREVRLQAS
jgi:hypothetical protein